MNKSVQRWKKRIQTIINHIDDSLVRVSIVAYLESSDQGLTQILPSMNSGSTNEVQLGLNKAGAVNLYLGWLARSLIDLRSNITSIDIQKLVIFLKAGELTNEIFEEKIKSSNKLFYESSSGIYPSIQSIFSNSTSSRGFSNESLELLQEVKLKCKVVERHLAILDNRFLRAITDRRFILSAFVISAASIPLIYLILLADSGQSISSQSIATAIQANVSSIVDAASSEKPLLDRISDIAQQLASIGANIPGILLLIAFLLSIFRGFMYRENWQHSGLKGFESELFELASKFKSALK